MTDEKLAKLAEDCDFDHWGPLNTAALRFEPAVRDMCRADTCKSYNKNWTCPPACGSLEEIAEKAAPYTRGILLQTTGQMEDDFDIETMMDTEQVHRQRFYQFVAGLRETVSDFLPMSAGACSFCRECTYPHAPCRNPEMAFTSMEACGLVVSDVCRESGVGYYYGPQTITFTSCVLLK